MTREEAITYGERKKASIQEKLCRDGSSYGDYSIYYSEMEFTSAALSALREQEKRRWIPLAERLPEHGDVVLCFMKFGEQRILQWDNVSSFWLGYGHGDDWQKADVTNWMPLPEPAKEEGELLL